MTALPFDTWRRELEADLQTAQVALTEATSAMLAAEAARDVATAQHQAIRDALAPLRPPIASALARRVRYADENAREAANGVARTNPTAVVRPRNLAHYSGVARPVLARRSLGARPRSRRAARAQNGCLVPEAALLLQRCHRCRTPQIWHHQVSFMSRCHRDMTKIPSQLWDRAANALAYAA